MPVPPGAAAAPAQAYAAPAALAALPDAVQALGPAMFHILSQKDQRNMGVPPWVIHGGLIGDLPSGKLLHNELETITMFE